MADQIESYDGANDKKDWIRAFRKLLKWPLFRNPTVAHFWVYCLLKATYRTRKVLHGCLTINLQPGEFIFGRHKASEETGLSQRTVRTCLVSLSRANCLKSTIHPTKQFSVITIVNWGRYQHNHSESDQGSDQGPTRGRPGADHKQEGRRKTKKEKESFSPAAKSAASEQNSQKQQQRPRDPIWDTVCEIFHLQPITDNQRSRTGKNVRDFKQLHATPETIREKYEAYCRQYPDPAHATRSPEAILNHWDSLAVAESYDTDAASQMAHALALMGDD